MGFLCSKSITSLSLAFMSYLKIGHRILSSLITLENVAQYCGLGSFWICLGWFVCLFWLCTTPLFHILSTLSCFHSDKMRSKRCCYSSYTCSSLFYNFSLFSNMPFRNVLFCVHMYEHTPTAVQIYKWIKIPASQTKSLNKAMWGTFSSCFPQH